MIWNTRWLGVLLSIVACAAWTISAAAGDRPKDNSSAPVKQSTKSTKGTKHPKPAHHGKATGGKIHGKKTTGAKHGKATGRPSTRHTKNTKPGKPGKPVHHTHPRPHHTHRPAK